MRWERVAFDLYGTLLDVDGLAAQLEPLAGAQAAEILAKWRKAQLERSWREPLYQPWDVVTAQALVEVAPQLDAVTRAKMCATWLSLPAHPDARQALEALRKAGVRTAVLSNGTLPMIRAALTAAGLEVDEVRSADEVRAYKTDPRVYALVPRETTLFVSGNGWDAEGAKRYGLSVAWIDRGTPPPGLAPDLRVRSLLQVAAAAVMS
jgi:2-haloacid dehalogenase